MWDRCTFQHLNWASKEGARRITASAAAFGENNERANSTWGSVYSLGNRSAWSISVACALWWLCSEWKVSKYETYWLFCLLMDAPCSIIIVTYAARVPAAVRCPLRGGTTPQPLPPFFLSNPLTRLQSSWNAFRKSSLIAQLKSTTTYWPFKSSSRVSLMKTFGKERGNKEELLNFELELKSDPAFHRERKTDESSEIKGCLSIGGRDVCEKIRLKKRVSCSKYPLKEDTISA